MARGFPLKPSPAFLKLIGRNVHAARVARRLTQAQLAKRLEVSDKTISRIERGVTNFDVGVLEQIARATGVSPSDLLNDS